MWSYASLASIKQTFSRLSGDLALLSAEGVCLTDARAAIDLDDDMICGEVVQRNGRLLMRVRGDAPVVLSAADERGALDILRLAEALVQALLKPDEDEGGLESLYRGVMLGKLSAAFLDQAAQEYDVKTDHKRCVMLLYVPRPGGTPLKDQIAEYLPLDEQDVLVEIDVHSVVLIKYVAPGEDATSLAQYAEAGWETLNGELAMDVHISLSDIHASVNDLRAAYQEAVRAFEVGRAYKPESHVHVYRLLVLQRLFSELDSELCARYHSLVFDRKTMRLFSDDMLATIEMFFQKDLNVSDTARQLFIHRNTLVYRLDKVQAQTGLDLRHFEDAVTFKVLMELRRKGASGAKGYEMKGGNRS